MEGGRSALVLWAPVALPPLVWMLHVATGWGAGALACGGGAKVPAARSALAAATVLGLALTAAALLVAWAGLRAPSPAAGEGDGTPERRRFVLRAGLVVSASFMLALLYAGVAPLILHACGEGR